MCMGRATDCAPHTFLPPSASFASSGRLTCVKRLSSPNPPGDVPGCGAPRAPRRGRALARTAARSAWPGPHPPGTPCQAPPMHAPARRGGVTSWLFFAGNCTSPNRAEVAPPLQKTGARAGTGQHVVSASQYNPACMRHSSASVGHVLTCSGAGSSAAAAGSAAVSRAAVSACTSTSRRPDALRARSSTTCRRHQSSAAAGLPPRELSVF